MQSNPYDNAAAESFMKTLALGCYRNYLNDTAKC